MRKSRNGQRRAFAAFTKFSVLLMCFAVVFALVLTTGVFDVGGDMSANVAEAKDGGSTSAISLDGVSDQNATVHNAMHGDSTAAQTFTYDLSNYNFSAANTSLHSTSSSGTGIIFWHGQTHKGAVESDLNDDGYDHAWGVGGDSWYGYGGVNYAAINVTIPTVIQNYRKAGFEVSAYYTATLYGYKAAYTKDTYIGISASAGAQSAGTFGNGQMQNQNGDYQNGINRNSVTVTLAENSTNLTLYIGREITTRWSSNTDNSCRSSMICAADTKVTFTITVPNATSFPSDGQAPTATITSPTPVSTDWTAYNGDQWTTSGSIGEKFLAEAAKYNDSYTLNQESSNLTVGMNTITQGSKTLELALKEYGVNASGSRVAADPSAANYYAGIATVSVYEGSRSEDTLRVTTDVSYGSPVSTYAEYGDGGATINYSTSNARSQGTLEIIFDANTEENTPLIIVISDSGGNEAVLTVTVRGIAEQSTPNVMTGAQEVSTAVPDAGMWYVSDVTNFQLMGAAEGFDLLWFYVVDYSDVKMPEGATDVTPANLYPYKLLSSADSDEFEYNFIEGTFGDATTDSNNKENGKTEGYYRFMFLAIDYAGNVYNADSNGNKFIFYAQVDYGVPNPEVKLTYDNQNGKYKPSGDANGDGIIDPAEDTLWVNTPITAEITFTPNFSGNRVVVVDANAAENYVYIEKEGDTYKIAEVRGQDMNASTSFLLQEDGTYVATGSGLLPFEKVTLSASYDAESGSVTLTAKYETASDALAEEIWSLMVYNNAYAKDYVNINYATEAVPAGWNRGVRLYIDRLAPEAPAVVDDGDYIIQNTTGAIPTGGVGDERVWYTAGWTLGAKLDLNIDEYATAYYLTKHYVDDNGYKTDKESILKDKAAGTWSAFAPVRYEEYGMEYPFTLNFGSAENGKVGYHVTYVFAVDRAGNVGSVAEYGVLVDAYEYRLSAVYAEGYQDKLGAPYVIGFVGADGKIVTADTVFHRGDEVTFSATLGDAYAGAYVPYKLEKKDANGDILGEIYRHPYDNNEAAFTTDGIQENYAFIRVESDGTLKLNVDRNSVEKLPMLGAEGGGNYAQIVFSYRKLVDVKPTTDMTDYTGKEITPEFSVTDLTANKGSVTFGNGESPYEFSSVHNDYGFKSILHAGTYTINVTYSAKESEFYVLNAEGSYPYTVNKGSIEMEVGFKEGSHTYGDVTAKNVMGLIEYTIKSGLVAADAEKVKSFTDLFGASAKFSLPGGTGYIPAGSYEVKAVFTANDYDVTVTWRTGSNLLTIEKRGLTVTAAENSWTYGVIPAGIKVTVPDTLGFGENEIAALFGVGADKVSPDATSGWTVELPFAAVVTDLQKNDGGYYNVGSYAVTKFTDALALDPNFTASIADGKDKIVINAAKVTVTPVINDIRVTDAADLANIVIAFVPTQGTEKFGVTGAFGVDTDSATGDAAYGLMVKTEFSSVHNDYVADGNDVVNVEINYEIEGVTVNVTIEVASGKFVITFNKDVSFSTPYGTLWTIENKYSVKYTSPIENDTVTEKDLESLDIEGYETEDVLANNVGYYQITFTPTLKGGLDPNDYIFEYVDADGNAVTGLTVTKKVVTVGEGGNATLTEPETLAKEYGAIDEELAYVITITEEGALKDHKINVGGIYRAANIDGTAKGGRYDDAGDYGIYAAEAVFSDADNFEIVLGDVTGTFVVNPKVINFKGDGVTLYGTDKVYNSAKPDASAPDARITLDNTVILNGDKVTLTYVAQYYEGDNTVSTIGSGYRIGFAGLELGGDDAKNYTLNGVTIVYTEPDFAIIADPIAISLDHFTVGKTYDAGTGTGDTKVSIAAISELYGKEFTIVSATYESADAGSVVVTVVLFFEGLNYPGEGEELANYYNPGSGVSIEAAGEKATDGVNITISGITGTIAQREITLDDINFLFGEEGSTYRTKVYDGTASVVVVPFDFEATFKSHFAEGFDVKADAALEFEAGTVGEAKNVGTGYLIDVTNVTLDSPNYKLAEAIEADGHKAVEDKIGGTFTINARPIELGIEIEDKTYDQSPDAEGSAWFGAAAEGESVSISTQAYEFVRNVNAGTADAASYEAFPYVQIGNLDSGHYWHDVRVTLTVTTKNFDWSNYDLQGYDVEVNEGKIVIVLEKAAYLDPVTISLTTEKIKAESKAYDGDNSATLDVSTAYETSAFLSSGDADAVKLTYTAVFASPNAGTGIGITASGFKFVAKDSTNENAQFIADSYKTYTGTLTEHKGLKADITPRVLTATATLPGKTYDGTVYGGVDESKIVWELSGFLGSDANNYSVEVLAAGYKDADVDADGNPGFVYGYYLVNNAQKGVMNYTIEAHETGEYNVYSAKAAGAAFSAELNKIIVAEYTENGAVRYLIPVGSISTADQALVDEIAEKLRFREKEVLNSYPAEGKIDPAQLIFTVKIAEGSKAFEKSFDDTVNVYNAKYGDNFKVELKDPASGGQALVGITLEQDDFSVSFADANVGTGKDIIFTVNVVGEQSNNNNFIFNESNSYTVKGAGTINAGNDNMRVGYDSVDSIPATYGSAGSALLGFTYQLGSYNILVDADGYAYILSTQWNAAFGRNDTSTELPLPTDRLYIKNTDGTFALITEGETVSGDQYVRINGRFTDLNVLSADGKRLINDEGLISAKAGTYEGAKAYVVNANFGIVEGTSATVTVNKAELTVTTDKDAYDAVYWTGTMPTPVFTVESGDAAFDDPAALAKAIKWAFKDTDGVAATVQSKPNSKGGSYTLTVEALDNYTVTIVNAEGETVAPALTITIPALDTTVYSAVESGTRPAQLGADGNAIALDETDLIRGVTDADVVDIKWSTTDGGVLEDAPADAGSYTWTATITRKIGNYYYDGAATLDGTFEITKRNVIVSLKAGSLSFVFAEGKTYTVSASDLLAVDAETGAAVENFVNVLGIGYSKDGVSVDGMTTAGAYNLVLTIGEEFEVNYALVDRVNAIRVTPKAVTVTVEDTSKSHNVTTSDADYAGIVFDSAGFENLTVTYRDGSGKVIGSTPKTPGIYTYTISSTDPNYTVSGNTTGTIRIVVSEVSFVKDGVTYATVSFTNPVATNYVLSDTTVSPNGNYWNIIDQNVAALAGEDEVLSTSGIVRVALSAGGNHTSGLSEKVTVTARIPDGVAAGFDVYYVTASGKLAPLSELDPEFRIEGGNIVYTTDYVSNLIFVNSSAPGFNWWIIPLIAAALILILALAILIGVLVKLHRAPDPVPVEVAPIDSIMPEPPVVAPVAAAPAPVFEPAPAADIEPATYDAPAAVSKHGQPPIIGIR